MNHQNRFRRFRRLAGGLPVLLGLFVFNSPAPLWAQQADAYRQAAQAYRDAAAKTSGQRAQCYLQWAQYYDDCVARLASNSSVTPVQPSNDCSQLPEASAAPVEANPGLPAAPQGSGQPAVDAGRSAERSIVTYEFRQPTYRPVIQEPVRPPNPYGQRIFDSLAAVLNEPDNQASSRPSRPANGPQDSFDRLLQGLLDRPSPSSVPPNGSDTPVPPPEVRDSTASQPVRESQAPTAATAQASATETAWVWYSQEFTRRDSQGIVEAEIIVTTVPQSFPYDQGSTFLFAPQDLQQRIAGVVGSYLQQQGVDDTRLDPQREHAEKGPATAVRAKADQTVEAAYQQALALRSPYSSRKIVLIDPATGQVVRDLTVEKAALPSVRRGAAAAE